MARISDRPQIPSRLYSLDVLRGVAALAVVFWHWQHLFYVGRTLSPSFRTDQQPLFSIFQPFYKGGALAVDLFFSLSGFIFFLLYSDAISSRRVTARDFLVLRLSRLYPLHLLTLLVVAIGQAVYLRQHGVAFIYQDNNASHFILNLLFISPGGSSFNGPIWSVSIEVALYALFFLLCRSARVGPWPLLFISLLGFFAVSHWYIPLSRGIGSFFIGGVVCRAYLHVVAGNRFQLLWKVVCATAVALWICVAACAYSAVDLGSFPLQRMTSADHVLPRIVFPITILAIALAETRRSTLVRRLAPLGDISYSAYLWHFPLQLLVAIVAIHTASDVTVLKSPIALLGFFIVLIAISWASNRFFEVPWQRRLRRQWLTRGQRRHRKTASEESPVTAGREGAPQAPNIGSERPGA